MISRKVNAIIDKLKKEGFTVSEVKKENNKTSFRVNGHGFWYCDEWTSSAADFVRYIKNILQAAANKNLWKL